MVVYLKNVELRGFEVRTSSKTGNQYLICYFEDSCGKGNHILCKNVALQSLIKKGVIADLTCELDISSYTKFELIGIDIGVDPIE